jgi:hypothetical protein
MTSSVMMFIPIFKKSRQLIQNVSGLEHTYEYKHYANNFDHLIREECELQYLVLLLEIWSEAKGVVVCWSCS